MTGRSLRVYLDSADFSRLSDLREDEVNLLSLKSKLLKWASSGTVEFRFSAAHVCEMAPVAGNCVDAAVRRAELLAQLCGKKALVSLDVLLLAELECLSTGAPAPERVYSDNGDWFPELADIVPPVSFAEPHAEFLAKVQQSGLGRKERRKLANKFSRNGAPRVRALQELGRQAGSGGVDEVVSQYPMRKQDAHVLRRYLLGQASRQDAEDAFLASLRDPSWMMRWFAAHSDKLTPISEWVRAPAESVIKSLKAAAVATTELNSTVVKVRKLAQEAGLSTDGLQVLDSAKWRDKQEQQVVDVASSLCERILGRKLPAGTSAADVGASAPGLATAIRALHSSAWRSVGLTAREPKPSDWADALHAVYAPYVDVFRTDSYMASVVGDIVRPYKAATVGKLNKLEAEIEGRLAARDT